MSATKPRIPSPFDADYVPQLDMGRQSKFKVPELEDRPRFFRDSISTESKGKKFRMEKASI